MTNKAGRHEKRQPGNNLSSGCYVPSSLLYFSAKVDTKLTGKN